MKLTNIACSLFGGSSGPVNGVCNLDSSEGASGQVIVAEHSFLSKHVRKVLTLITKEDTPRQFRIRIEDMEGRFTGFREI